MAQQDGAHHRALPARRQLGHHCAIHQPGAVGIAQAKRDRGKQGGRQRQPGRRPGGQGRARWLHAAAVRRGRTGHQPIGVHQAVVRPVQRPAWRDHAGLLAPPAGGAPLGAGEQPQGAGRLFQKERPELCRHGHRQRTAPGRRSAGARQWRPLAVHPLQGRCHRHSRHRGRANPGAHERHAGHPAPGAKRQAQGAGRFQVHAHAADWRRAHHCRARHPGL